MYDKIIFLDFDGVVNTPIWMNYTSENQHTTRFEWRYAHPFDGFVNNFQAICWLNEVYSLYPYDIVITSSWRIGRSLTEVADFLYNGGLNKDIAIIDCLPFDKHKERDELIIDWLNAHHDIDNYVVIDDDNYYYNTKLEKRTVLTDPNVGITLNEYYKICHIFTDTSDIAKQLEYSYI